MIQRLRQMRNEEGFTLIELLIVIIVLGILAAIVVFAVGSTRDDATASACKTDVKAVQLSAEAIKTTGGSYPTTAQAANLANESAGGLLKEMPAGITYTSPGGDPDGTGPLTTSAYQITPSTAMQSAGCDIVYG